jgi:UDP-3-O-[3-hydroxymyristoyl] glucosamine N-acyltransferase
MLPRLRKSNSLTPCALANGLSLTELADRIYGTIICGQKGLFYTGIAALDTAGPGDISFLGNDKYISQFLTTKAGAVIIPTGHDFGNHPAALVAVANPSLAFAEIVRHFAATSNQVSIRPHASTQLLYLIPRKSASTQARS